ncbi:Uncharacterised protein [Chlamydia trachomatis]|nr:Uncharacterised protein [Chlamydia trachomatis]
MTKTKKNLASEKRFKKIIALTKKYDLNFYDELTNQNYSLKIEINPSKKELTRIILPTENNFFKGVEYSEKVQLKELANGRWTKKLHAKFGTGAKELFGVTELNENSDLEARDIRIIAFVDDFLSKLAENSIHTTPLLLKPSIKA